MTQPIFLILLELELDIEVHTNLYYNSRRHVHKIFFRSIPDRTPVLAYYVQMKYKDPN